MQRFYEASDGAGNVARFFWPVEPHGETIEQAWALTQALKYAGDCGYVVLMERERLNDYVGPPIWSEPIVIEEV